LNAVSLQSTNSLVPSLTSEKSRIVTELFSGMKKSNEAWGMLFVNVQAKVLRKEPCEIATKVFP
jgi:hypothetical protein